MKLTEYLPCACYSKKDNRKDMEEGSVVLEGFVHALELLPKGYASPEYTMYLTTFSFLMKMYVPPSLRYKT